MATASSVPPETTRIVIDNGGHTCKVGFAGQREPVKCMLNGLVKTKGTNRVYVADQVEKCNESSGLQYRLSLERGCLVNWDTQAEVWSRALGSDVLKVNPSDCSLLLTEIPLCPTAIQDTLDEMVFEHFGFQSYCTRPAPLLASLAIAEQQDQQQEKQPPRSASLVIDAGFSATHFVPIFGSSIAATAINFAAKRLNVGGKLLTNQLKQVISFRAYNVMEETSLIQDCKESLCYISLDFANELALTRFKGKKNTLRREFVMPDYVNTFKGTARDPNAPPPPQTAAPAAASSSPRDRDGAPAHKKKAFAVEEQVLSLSNERIALPEVLFSPTDIGLEQAGVAECVVQATEACIPDLREALYSNILLTGGSSSFPNFEERLRRELRQLVPSEYEIGITSAAQPTLSAWRGGSIFASSDEYASQVVTKKEYREEGHALCRRRFAA